jgi:hypothetical protein
MTFLFLRQKDGRTNFFKEEVLKISPPFFKEGLGMVKTPGFSKV